MNTYMCVFDWITDRNLTSSITAYISSCSNQRAGEERVFVIIMMLLLVLSVLLAPAAVYGLNLSVNVGASDDYCLPLLSFTWTLNDTMGNGKCILT